MRGISRASETVEKAATPLFRMDDSLLRAESDCLRQRDSTRAGGDVFSATHMSRLKTDFIFSRLRARTLRGFSVNADARLMPRIWMEHF